MNKKEARQKVFNFFEEKEIDFDSSQNTKVLFKKAVENNFTEISQSEFDEIFTPAVVTEIPDENEKILIDQQAEEEKQSRIEAARLQAEQEKQAELLEAEKAAELEAEKKAEKATEKAEKKKTNLEDLREKGKIISLPDPEEKKPDNILLWILIVIAIIIIIKILQNAGKKQIAEGKTSSGTTAE